MNILKTYTNKITDDNGVIQHLTIELTESGGIYGFSCTLMPAGQSAADTGATEEAENAERIFEILCREDVLPLNLYSVLSEI